ncbi:MAG: preprotein translocase subunit SecA [Planctomycetota bacterium]|jgi:preprotein translocase subunit SecA
MFRLFGKVFLKLIGGSRNDRIMRAKMHFVREQFNPLEEQMRSLSDGQMLQRSLQLKRRREGGENREDLKAEVFALVREASRRARDHRQFDVQLVGGLILDEGWVIEEATGEGKTIACYPAIYMAWLDGMHTHLVTVNDVLVKRDADFARPIFELLGMTVGYITADMPCYGPEAEVRRRAYACDLTYGTNNEFGFDYLRDNMKLSTADQVQGPLDFAIVDEVDSILIDEARTPLIISGAARGSTELYRKADSVCRELLDRNRPWDRVNRRLESLKRQLRALEGELDKAKGDGKAEVVQQKLRRTEVELAEAEGTLSQKEKLYEIDLERKSAHMTDEGVRVAQELAGVGSFYVGANMEWPHLMEQSLRAHLVYECDKDYIVRESRVVIVDEFTGRLLEGREWSDGLHQAVEAKERVPVKEETQTLATITLQNFFRLYKKLAGMTGTAMTEAGEFLKIYKLDAAAVPTHRPVNRADHEDRIYADIDAKYDAIVEEIRYYSRNLRRPVLVGTTSIEKSEKLSELLQRRYGIEHQVLNGRPENAARENEIVAQAGQQRTLKKGSKEMAGTVTIATNMAGRGTDIKLGAGVVYQKCKVPPEEKLAELGVEAESLFPTGTTKCCIHCPQYDPTTNCAHCFKPKIDPDFPLKGRTGCRQEVPCGLHIVGTERHEARRIDNQLRGRSGRQGDPGSSRFFLSLRDDLVAIFAGPWTLKVLGWLGLQGDQNIEHPRVSKGIARAQRKVEERYFEVRKNLLEYDEVMDYQRRTFYSQRQKILAGRGLEGLVKKLIRESVSQAVADYLDGRYPQRCVAKWARQTLQIPIDDDQIDAESMEDLPSLEEQLRDRAKDEAYNVISMTLGEYMDEDIDREEWDLRGLSSWAMSRFNVNLSQNQLRRMTPAEVEQALSDAAAEKISRLDLAPVAKYLEEDFVAESLAHWARNKLLIDIEASRLKGPPEEIEARLLEKVEDAYARREIEYPVEYAVDMTVGQTGTENVYALGRLAEWANRKFDAGLDAEQLRGARIEDIRDRLIKLAERYLAGGLLEESIRRSLGDEPDPEPAIEFARNRFDTELKSDDLRADVFGKLVEVGRRYLRREMTELERFVLLQIYDSSWKDHLLEMDHLRSGIGLRGYAEQDPRVAYKREGSRMFQEMLAQTREKVTDMIFKVRLAAGEEMESVYQVSNMVHEQLTGYDHLAREMAEQAQAEPQKIQTIIRQGPKVGRNDPCPCGSGKKYKKCCGRNL